MNTRVALANLVLAQLALTRIGLRPFLVDGTLLGAVRERAFIAHDRDTDMGLFIEDWRPSIPLAMHAVGFRMRRQFGSVDCGYEISFRRGGIKLDVFFYYEDKASRFHAAWPKSGIPIRYEYWKFDLAPLVFIGTSFLAPDDPERFCATKYGPDWRTPVADWDWAWGPRNARPWVDA